MSLARLELGLRPAGAGQYALEARFRLQPSAAEAAPLAGGAAVRLDCDLLTALSLDPAAYGRALGAMLLADEPARQALVAARAQAEALDGPLRLCLRLPADDPAAHALRWETLIAPQESAPLALQRRVLFSRYLDSPDMRPVLRRPPGELRALVAVADPQGLAPYGLGPIDAPALAAAACRALAPIPARLLARHAGQPASLAALSLALGDEPDILYLVCHGTERLGETTLWLEDEGGGLARVPGAALAEALAALARPPLLVALSACRSAGPDPASPALALAGPRLARAGIPAVLAMQGSVDVATVELLMPALFRELARDGQVDRALAAARAAVAERIDWWMPALFLRLEDGCLWADDARAGQGPPADRRSVTMINQGYAETMIGFKD